MSSGRDFAQERCGPGICPLKWAPALSPEAQFIVAMVRRDSALAREWFLDAQTGNRRVTSALELDPDRAHVGLTRNVRPHGQTGHDQTNGVCPPSDKI